MRPDYYADVYRLTHYRTEDGKWVQVWDKHCTDAACQIEEQDGVTYMFIDAAIYIRELTCGGITERYKVFVRDDQDPEDYVVYDCLRIVRLETHWTNIEVVKAR